MQTLTELLVRTADLAEAEGRLLRAMTVRLALGIAVILVAAVVVATGVALLLASIFILTTSHLGPAVGAAVTGIVALATGGFLAWLGRKMAS